MQHLLKIPQTQKSYEIQTQSRQWFKVERDPERKPGQRWTVFPSVGV